jgi:1-acyl-sn-glycerol-3-phosphate acyltransferase
MNQTVDPQPAAAAAAAPPVAAGLPTNTRTTWVYRLGRGLLRLFGVVMFRLRTTGVKNIPKRGGVLIVANHQSYLDPAAFGVNVRRPLSFLAKSELFENKFFGGLIRAVNAFPVRQGEGDVGAVREAIKRLQEGHVLLMFPEGGRSDDGEVMKMEAGVGLIIRRAGPTVRVVPAATYGAYEAWPRQRLLPRPGRVRVKYGEAMNLSDRKASDIIRIVEARIRELFEELRAEAKAERQ